MNVSGDPESESSNCKDGIDSSASGCQIGGEILGLRSPRSPLSVPRKHFKTLLCVIETRDKAAMQITG